MGEHEGIFNRSVESQESQEKRRKEINKEMFELVKEMEGETFAYPGITPESYGKMKADDIDYPDYTTPIDELIERLKLEGMKVVPSASDPKTGNIFVIPKNSNNVKMDGCISLEKFQIVDEMDERLKKLIELKRAL